MTQKPDIESSYLPISEAVKKFGMSRYKIYRLKNSGKINIFKVEGSALISVRQMESYIQSCAV